MTIPHFTIGILLIIWTIFFRYTSTTSATMCIILFPVFCVISVWRPRTAAASIFIRTQVPPCSIMPFLWLRNAVMDYAIVLITWFEHYLRVLLRLRIREPINKDLGSWRTHVHYIWNVHVILAAIVEIALPHLFVGSDILWLSSVIAFGLTDIYDVCTVVLGLNSNGLDHWHWIPTTGVMRVGATDYFDWQYILLLRALRYLSLMKCRQSWTHFIFSY